MYRIRTCFVTRCLKSSSSDTLVRSEHLNSADVQYVYSLAKLASDSPSDPSSLERPNNWAVKRLSGSEEAKSYLPTCSVP